MKCLLTVLVVLASQAIHAQTTTDETIPAEWFFSEDHHTGALYLHLGPESKYALQAREHRGIFLFDVGEWSLEDGVFTLRSSDPAKPVTRVRLEGCNGRQFLIGLTDHWPSGSRDREEVCGLLDEGEQGSTSLVFFRIGRSRYEQVIECPYPFKFYPEMNVPCPGKHE